MDCNLAYLEWGRKEVKQQSEAGENVKKRTCQSCFWQIK